MGRLKPSREATPLWLIAVGLAIVVLDFRLQALDLLFDPIGWLLVAVAALWLSLRTAALVAALAAVLSVSDALLPYHHDHPLAGEEGESEIWFLSGFRYRVVYEPVTGVRLAVMASAVVVAAVALRLLLGGLAGRAWSMDEVRTAGRLRAAWWFVVGLWAIPYLAVVAHAAATDGSFDPVWNGELEYLAFLGVVPFVWLMWFLVRESSREWVHPVSALHQSPWALMRWRKQRSVA